MITKIGLMESWAKPNQYEAQENAGELFILEKELDDEIAKIIGSQTQMRDVQSSNLFWKDRHDLPRLRELFIVLNTICSSSAFIERYFNISGIVCKQRAMNMNDDLIIARGLLKTNMNILEEMNKVFE